MTLRSARIPLALGALLVCAAGGFVALRGDSDGPVAVSPAASAAVSTTTTVIEARASAVASVQSAAVSPLAQAATDVAPAATVATVATAAPTQPPAQPVLARPEPTQAPSPVTATPTAAPPLYSALDVLNRSRDVPLPSGKSFSECVIIGAESGPWSAQVHDYWNLDGTWTVETHTGDVGLIFVEATQSYRVRNIDRHGC